MCILQAANSCDKGLGQSSGSVCGHAKLSVESVSMSVQGASYRVTWWGMALLLVSSMQEVSITVANVFSEIATSFEEPGELLDVPGTHSTLISKV